MPKPDDEWALYLVLPEAGALDIWEKRLHAAYPEDYLRLPSTDAFLLVAELESYMILEALRIGDEPIGAVIFGVADSVCLAEIGTADWLRQKDKGIRDQNKAVRAAFNKRYGPPSQR